MEVCPCSETGSERAVPHAVEALAGVDEYQDPVETIGRLGVRLIVHQATDDEVTELLGRGRYERAEEPISHRSGYEPRTMKTASGPVELERLRVRDAAKRRFKSRVLGRHVTRTYELESLVIS